MGLCSYRQCRVFLALLIPMMKFPDTLTQNDQEVLTLAPVMVFVLLAATSGQVSSTQQKAFAAILKGAEDVPCQAFAAALFNAREDYESLRKSVAGRRIDPSAEFERVREVLDSGRMEEDESDAFGHGLFYLADSVSKAGAKKRMFGLLGRKTPVGNRELVRLVHQLFVENVS